MTNEARAAAEAMREKAVKKWSDWLVDAVAMATQDRRYLRGEPQEDCVATEAILLNGEKAIRNALRDALPLPEATPDSRDEASRRWYEQAAREEDGQEISGGIKHPDLADPRDETVLRCRICGFVIDGRYAAEKPTVDFTTAGRAKKSAPDPRDEALRLARDALEPFANVAKDIGSDETDEDQFQPYRSNHNRAPKIKVGACAAPSRPRRHHERGGVMLYGIFLGALLPPAVLGLVAAFTSVGILAQGGRDRPSYWRGRVYGVDRTRGRLSLLVEAVMNYVPRRTGRVRHRVQRHWGKDLLVLQVQVKGIVTEYLAGSIDLKTVVWWRDAEVTEFEYLSVQLDRAPLSDDSDSNDPAPKPEKKHD